MEDVLPCRSPSADTRECRPVRDAGELAAHHFIRRAVFVDEQALFGGDDRDGRDDDPATVHVLGLVGGVPAGTVRLYPLTGSRWKGDRLAVLPAQRASGIGGPLVRFAVATAARHGGHCMDALVQQPNTAFFERLGWACAGPPVDHLGVGHQPMTIAF